MSAGPFGQDSLVTYEIIVTNEGSLDAANVEVTDTPQVGLTYVSSNASGLSNVTETSNGVWLVADLDQGLTQTIEVTYQICLLYTSPSPRDLSTSRMPSSA